MLCREISAAVVNQNGSGVCVCALLCCPDSAFPSLMFICSSNECDRTVRLPLALLFHLDCERSFKLTSPRFLVVRFCLGAVNKVKCLSYLKHSVHNHQSVSSESEKCQQNMSKLCETVQFCHLWESLQRFYLVSQTLCV